MRVLLISLFFISCSHLREYNAPKHYDVISQNNDEFYLLKELKNSSINRTIASVSDDMDLKENNKNLYFITIYNQYKTLALLSGGNVELDSCPAFHQTWLKHRDDQRRNITLPTITYGQKELENIYLYPELGLMTPKGERVASLVSGNHVSQQTIQTALENYNQKNRAELSELCDRGVSANYFVYENMISFYSTSGSFNKDFKGLHIYLKMPIVSNTFLIDRFGLNSLVSKVVLEKRLKAYPFLTYLNEVRSQRALDTRIGEFNNF